MKPTLIGLPVALEPVEADCELPELLADDELAAELHAVAPARTTAADAITEMDRTLLRRPARPQPICLRPPMSSIPLDLACRLRLTARSVRSLVSATSWMLLLPRFDGTPSRSRRLTSANTCRRVSGHYHPTRRSLLSRNPCVTSWTQGAYPVSVSKRLLSGERGTDRARRRVLAGWQAPRFDTDDDIATAPAASSEGRLVASSWACGYRSAVPRPAMTVSPHDDLRPSGALGGSVSLTYGSTTALIARPVRALSIAASVSIKGNR
jgi:hypothetical protein